MRIEAGITLLSPSDLMRFMGCAHAITLDLARLRGEGPEPVEDSEEAELVQAHGHAHEASYLTRLETGGRRVVEIDKDSLDPATAAARTREALAEGPEVVFQAALFSDRWGGYADFLERVERPSDLGPFSYEWSTPS